MAKQLQVPFTTKLPYPVYFRTARLTEEASYPRHHHPWGEFVYAFSGVMELKLAHSHYLAPPQYGIWLPPGVEHVGMNRREASHCSLYLAPERCRALPKATCALAASPLVKALLEHLREHRVDYPRTSGDRRLLQVLIDQLALAPPQGSYLPMSDDPLLRPVLMALEKNPADGRSVAQWARQVHHGAHARAPLPATPGPVLHGLASAAARRQGAGDAGDRPLGGSRGAGAGLQQRLGLHRHVPQNDGYHTGQATQPGPCAPMSREWEVSSSPGPFSSRGGPMWRSWTRFWLCTAVVLALAGCSAPDTVPPKKEEQEEPRRLVSLTVTPDASVALLAGQTQAFQAHGSFSDGTREELTSSVSWSSSDTTIVAVSPEGQATGVQAGSAQLTASSEGLLSNAATVEVNAPPRPVLTLWPPSSSVPQGDGVAFIATLTQPDGKARDVTFTGTWASSDPSVFFVGPGAMARALAPGTASITVSAGGVTSNSATVHVRPLEVQWLSVTPREVFPIAGQTQRFTVTAHFSDRTVRDVTATATWASSNPAVATVSAGGLATTYSPGQTYLTAFQGGAASVIPLSVRPAIRSIEIIPDTLSIAEGETWPLIAYVTLDDGATLDMTRDVTWASSEPAVAVVDTSKGYPMAQGVATGTTLLTASHIGATSKSALLSVRPRIIRSISVTPVSASVRVRGKWSFTAIATLVDGVTRDVTAEAWWQSSDRTVAVAEGRVVTGVATGKCLITATLEGVTSEIAELTVKN